MPSHHEIYRNQAEMYERMNSILLFPNIKKEIKEYIETKETLKSFKILSWKKIFKHFFANNRSSSYWDMMVQ
ncbi:hypothetical protein D3P08_09605 [Paenibacillus nanensis]|uniref:Uncharacterized protein n=1 Tax=Paenibacillus nanensis TaxID=393251 RepID=A0A3A1V8B1_9BACL|nr:hypothetical protein [Paenibacillus nanensis]RIX53670.1 hypothetical protein D3P08_09605 [Paenibacillus nanensis]